MVEWSGWDGLCGLGLWPHRYPHHKVFQCCIQQQNDQKLLQYLQQTDIKCHINSHWPSILIRWWLSNGAELVLLIVHVSCAFFGEIKHRYNLFIVFKCNALSKAKLTLFGGWDTCVPTLGTHVSQPPIIIISGMCPNPADDQLSMD